jgi:hypothetical protein
VDPAYWHLDNPLPYGLMDWTMLTPEDATGDRLTRHLLLTNVDHDVRLTVENLTHASLVWRTLNEVT